MFSLVLGQRQSHGLAIFPEAGKQWFLIKDSLVIPDTLKFLLVVGLIAGLGYGGVLALATFPPEPSEVIRPLSHDKLRQN